MILQSLARYYDLLREQGLASPPGYAQVKVAFALNLDSNGHLINLIPLSYTDETSGKTVRFQTLTMPEPYVRANGIVANFLCDGSSYLLGVDNRDKPERTQDCFEASRKLHLDILKSCTGSAAQAIRAFYESWTPDKNHPEVESKGDDLFSGNIAFRIDGRYASEDEEIQNTWGDYRSKTVSQSVLPCLVTGERLPISAVHGKIKGVRNAQPAGASIVSFNAPSLESFRKDQGINAPVSEKAAFAYVTALNWLLSSREHHCLMGDSTVVFWAESFQPEVEDLLSATLRDDDEQPLEEMMRKIAQGDYLNAVALSSPFYLLALSPNAGRISVRFFLSSTLGQFVQSLKAHYDRLAITHAPYEKEYLSIWRLLRETVNQKNDNKNASPLLSGAVLSAILTNSRYPDALRQAAMARIRAEREVTRGRTAIIKAFLLQNYPNEYKEVISVALNEQTTDRSYVLGRLFSVLEAVQEAANPGINATIKDRFFTSACATPGPVFPRLLQLSNHHLAKLEDGKSTWYSRQIGLLMDLLPALPFPTHQTLNEQGMFILGYYQQRQARFTKKEEK